MISRHKPLAVVLLLTTLIMALPLRAATARSFVDTDRAFTFEKGSGLYQIRFNYTGRNLTHADVAGIRIHAESL